LAGALLRRNIGAEVSLFTGIEAIPRTTAGWFDLLQTSPLLGLSFLAVFDLANRILEGLVFLALAAAFWQARKSPAVVALASGLVGIGVSFSANISLSMLAVSRQYTSAAGEAQKAALLSAGQVILAGNDPLALAPGTGAYMSWLLIAAAGLIFSTLMLRANRAAGVVGLLAGGCDLLYCLTFAAIPALQVVWQASGGLFWMIWHILTGLILLKRAKEDG